MAFFSRRPLRPTVFRLPLSGIGIGFGLLGSQTQPDQFGFGPRDPALERIHAVRAIRVVGPMLAAMLRRPTTMTITIYAVIIYTIYSVII
ncbi:hypothetical protein CRH09_00065 [Nocardia terpenica]|uniref:Uncharacterized protein n=1 Tax=Nocardia terpenica TaxID=455432 RepID=A0A291RC63_9NOCA|nr:hypothetical protein CRH09_00065 [Nocardia terpenica]